MLTFDDPSHTYRWNDIVVPGVTTILKPLSGYDSVPRHILDEAAARGTAIHKAVELHCAGTLDYESLPDVLIPYVIAWENFVSEKRPAIVGSEQRGYHTQLGYAGTWDLELGFKGDKQPSMVDIKSCVAMMPSVGPQLSAYKEIINAGRPRSEQVKKRFGLQLKKNGTYELHQYKDEVTDWNAFLSCLNLLRFRAHHDMKEIEL